MAVEVVDTPGRRHLYAADTSLHRTGPGVLLATGDGVTVQRDRIELPAETAAIAAL
ncbi:hypothetical protein O3597_13135 [Verrucosispora sp. WMMA2044]|uniref:hypothetical protein n=1 Tax=Verrucosispora sp. WMMA2044 TaxID=3016419 RepID=UPI00248C4C2C|nr:hypothetical protein [Verrucosispora sp. WMMA2044]WBB51348.1 hypothetical protein O3597_13135 [Verrucosispora sp. WMMA2044]